MGISVVHINGKPTVILIMISRPSCQQITMRKTLNMLISMWTFIIVQTTRRPQD